MLAVALAVAIRLQLEHTGFPTPCQCPAEKNEQKFHQIVGNFSQPANYCLCVFQHTCSEPRLAKTWR